MNPLIQGAESEAEPDQGIRTARERDSEFFLINFLLQYKKRTLHYSRSKISIN